MTVPPASQLTRRMVPASTLRRNEATMTGMTNSTATTTAPAMAIVFMERAGRREGSTRGSRHGTAAASRVDFGDAHHVAGPDTSTTRALVRCKRGEKLDELAIDFHRHGAAAGRVEACNSTGLVVDARLERGRGARLEAEEEAPQRTDDCRLENRGGENARAELPRLAKWRGDDAARSEAD